MTATWLLGWTNAQMSAAIASGSIVLIYNLMTMPLGKWVPRDGQMLTDRIVSPPLGSAVAA